MIVAHDSGHARPGFGYEDLLDEPPPTTSDVRFQDELGNILGPERLFSWLIAKEPLASQWEKVTNQYGIEPTVAKDLLEDLIGWKSQVAIGGEHWVSHPDEMENFLGSVARALQAQLESALDQVPPEARISLIREWTQRFAEEAWSKP